MLPFLSCACEEKPIRRKMLRKRKVARYALTIGKHPLVLRILTQNQITVSGQKREQLCEYPNFKWIASIPGPRLQSSHLLCKRMKLNDLTVSDYSLMNLD